MGIGGTFPLGVKWPGCEADCSPLSVSEFKNSGAVPPLFPICRPGVHRDNVTFNFQLDHVIETQNASKGYLFCDSMFKTASSSANGGDVDVSKRGRHPSQMLNVLLAMWKKFISRKGMDVP